MYGAGGGSALRVGPLLRGLAATLAFFLLALAAAACNGDGGNPSPQADETPSASQTPAANESPATGKDVEDLKALGAKSADVVAAVTYKYRAELKGQTAQTVEGEWVLVRRSPDVRFEVAPSGAGRTIIISSRGKRYVCTSANGKEQCLATAEVGQPIADLAPFFDVPRQVAASPAEVSLVGRSQRTIAGHDASCFTTSAGLVGVGESPMCLSVEGIILFLSMETSQGTFTFEAVSVSQDVTDEDFKPPYSVVEAPPS